MTTSAASAATVLIEAEGFLDHGGWSLDPQFIREMGSPCTISPASTAAATASC